MLSWIFAAALPAASISGRVFDNQTGQPVSSAVIWVQYYHGDGFLPVYTDINGYYHADGLNAGTYQLWYPSQQGYVSMHYYATQHWDQIQPITLSDSDDLTGYDFPLEKSALLSGMITASDGETWVPGAQVVAFQYHDWITSTTTGQLGQYTLNGLLANQTYRIAVYPPDDSSDRITRRDFLVQPGSANVLEIQLDPDGFTLAGHVYDKATGQPLEGIWVGTHISDPDYEFFGGNAVTDANGYYQIDHLPGVQVDYFVDRETQYARSGGTIYFDQDVLDADIYLEPPATVSGLIVDYQTGQPVDGIKITASNDSEYYWQQTTSNARGEFQFDQVPQGYLEIGVFPALSQGYCNNKYWMNDIIWVDTADHITNKVIYLRPGPLVTGRLVHSDGSPIANIEAEFSAKWTEGDFLTDADGAFQIRLPLGRYGLNIGYDRDDHDYGLSQMMLNSIQIDSLSDPVNLGNLTLYSDADGGTIRGIVTDGGPPVVQVVAIPAGFELTSENWWYLEPVSFAEVDMSGPFVLRSLPPGAYDIYAISVEETEDEFERITLVANAKGVTVGTVGIRLTPAGSGRVQGRIKNSDGAPVLGAEALFLNPATGDFAGFAQCDREGAFELGSLKPGTYQVIPVSPYYQSRPVSVTVTADSLTHMGDLTLAYSTQPMGPDLDGNGQVNIADLVVLASNWLEPGLGDLDNSGRVDNSDWTVLTHLWQRNTLWSGF